MHPVTRRTQAKAIAVTRNVQWGIFMAISGLSFIFLCLAKI